MTKAVAVWIALGLALGAARCVMAYALVVNGPLLVGDIPSFVLREAAQRVLEGTTWVAGGTALLTPSGRPSELLAAVIAATLGALAAFELCFFDAVAASAGVILPGR